MKRLLTSLCASVLMILPFPASAQNECVTIPDEIIPLRLPNFEVPVLWKKTMGIDGPDRAVDLISLADGGFVIVGESALFDRDKGLQPKQLYLARLDVNGKIIWEKRMPLKGFVRAAAGIAVKDRLAVLSEVSAGEKSKATQLDYFDGLGNLKSTKVFSDPKFDLIPEGVVPDPKTQNLTIAFWSSSRTDPKNNFTVINKISPDGKTLLRREYLPGLPNRLESFRRMKNGDFIGSGRILYNGVTAGWIIRISEQGDLIFQRPYARGSQSNLRKITEDADGNFIVVGDSIPSGDGGLRAAWIFKVNAQGVPLWQRFIKGKYAFSGTDVSVVPDDRIVTMVNAQPVESEGGGRDHVRVISFTPNGRMIGDEAVIEGANARGVNLMARNHSRVISGMTQSGLVEYGGVADQKSAGYDLWIMGLPKLGAYADPCAIGKPTDNFDDGY